MIKFNTEQELQNFLGKMQRGYGDLAPALWKHGVTNSRHLSRVPQSRLRALGATPAQATNIPVASRIAGMVITWALAYTAPFCRTTNSMSSMACAATKTQCPA